MTTSAGQEPNPIPRIMNPLWIISLFLGLSEVTVGFATTQASGWIQGLLAVFATLFPLIVSFAFFWILTHKPYVLYAPGDFSEHTPVASFVQAMSVSTSPPVSVIEATVRSAVESIIPRIAQSGISPEERSSALDYALEVARVDLERRTIKVDISAAFDDPTDIERILEVPADETTGINALLDRVFFSISDVARPFTYGISWVLRADQIIYTEMGTHWARRHGRKRDNRSISEVGIEPGSALSVQLLDPRE